jgi:hypothetical protein
MKFKELTDEDKQYFTEVYLDKTISYHKRMNMLGEYANKSPKTMEKWVKQLNLTEKTITDSPELIEAKSRKFDKKKKRFIISWAQNNTPVHRAFLANIKKYALEIDADIHIIAGRYQNPTSIFSEASKNADHWHSSVVEYLDAARHDIHKYVSIMSDIKIPPTGVNPMTGMQGISGINSCIFGSPKVQLEMIPVLEGNAPKMMMTTGACTVSNYTDSKSGKKGELHHTLGFVVVEIKDNNTFFTRQVTATDDGNFIDLCYKADYDEEKEESKITRNSEMDACVFGDLHCGHEDPEVVTNTLAALDKIIPENVILHDVFDGASISHHEMKNPFAQYRKEVKGTNSLGDEVDYMIRELGRFQHFKNTVIVRSNHDDFIDRWLQNGDWKQQPTPKNSMLYMEYSQMLLRQYAEDDDVKGVIPELINKAYPKYKTLGRSDSYIVNGWELGQHGDYGSNGSRGSLLQFRKLNTKIVVGHYHSPGRKDGALAVGTSTHLRVGYNTGPSSWLQSHVFIYKNGKAQHINFIDGEFTTFDL